MAEPPPFEMPGHRWDSDKKRFFKILPGQSSSSSSCTGSHSPGNKREGKGKEKEKKTDEYWKTTPRLPAIQIISPYQTTNLSGKAQTYFVEDNTIDPIRIKQQGRNPLKTPSTSETSRVAGTYSHLTLFQVQKPFAQIYPSSGNILGIQTHLDGQSISLLCDTGHVLRWCPTSGHLLSYEPNLATWGDEVTPTFIWGNSQLFFKAFLTHNELHFRFTVDGRGRGSTGVDGVIHSLPITQEASTQSSIGGFSDNNRTVAEAGRISLGREKTFLSWAMTQALLPPSDYHAPPSRRYINNNNDGDKTNWRKFTILAISTGDSVQIQILDPSRPSSSSSSHCYSFPPQHLPQSKGGSTSDKMALCFNTTGEILYYGTRSGLVFAWSWQKPFISSLRPSFPQDHIRTLLEGEGEGSVTNLYSISETELLVVRINGKVELFDLEMRGVKRRFEGHVNQYDFKLGFAVDGRLRIFALGGLDCRVRAWSFDSPFPLGTNVPCLTPVYHPLRNCTERRGSGEETDSHPEAHPNDNNQKMKTISRGTTLTNTQFPKEVRALHWHPRYHFEGLDPFQVQALAEEQQEHGRDEEQPWMDLVVASGESLYLFRWP